MLELALLAAGVFGFWYLFLRKGASEHGVSLTSGPGQVDLSVRGVRGVAMRRDATINPEYGMSYGQRPVGAMAVSACIAFANSIDRISMRELRITAKPPANHIGGEKPSIMEEQWPFTGEPQLVMVTLLDLNARDTVNSRCLLGTAHPDGTVMLDTRRARFSPEDILSWFSVVSRPCPMYVVQFIR